MYANKYREKASSELLFVLDTADKKAEGHQVVVLSQLLASPLSVGYSEGARNVVLKAFNGTPVTSLIQLISLVEACTDDFLIFQVGQYGEELVFERSKVESAEKELLTMHKIASPVSTDLKHLKAIKID